MPTALLSAYDKTGIDDFATELWRRGWKLIASGGTAHAIAGIGLPVTNVADVIRDATRHTIKRVLDRLTIVVEDELLSKLMCEEQIGEPILNHRVVTLSREVHGGLLARILAEDQATLKREGIPWIDLVYVNLYPLGQALARPDKTLDSVLEMTDIGGPAVIMAAVKGQRFVVCEHGQISQVYGYLRGTIPADELKTSLRMVAVRHVATYYRLLGHYFRDEYQKITQ